MVVALAALLAAGFALTDAPTLLRVLTGLPAALVLPGYAPGWLLFPRGGDLNWPERIGLSCGLSLAIVTILGLGLNFSPWKLTLTPIVVAVTGWTLLGTALAAWLRPRPAGRQDPTAPPSRSRSLAWTAAVGLGATVVALLIGLGPSALISAPSRPATGLTEFYVLGEGDLAERYPSVAPRGETVRLTVGISNHEGETVDYHIVVEAAGIETSISAPQIQLADGETWQGTLAFSPLQTGRDGEIRLILYRAGLDQPYRQLRLLVDSVDPNGSTSPPGASRLPANAGRAG